MLNVRAAHTGDLDAIMAVLEAAKGIMRASGNTGQWVNGYPSGALILSDIDNGHGFAVMEGERLVAYFAFIPSPEPTYSSIYEGKWLDDTLPYHVVHRIGSYPEVHGVFKTVMDWCFSQDGNIRIDTHRDNRIMQHNILKYGFEYCGIIYLASGDERLAYQKINMETDRILLRPWRESDAETLFKYASDPEVGPRAGWPPHKSVEESREIIRTVFNDATNTWAIVLKETGEPVGAMGYGPSCQCKLPAREGEPLTGYWVARPYWNRGICTEALRLMIDHICQTTDIRSLISGHFIDNPASGRVMEKCGFIPTGETVVDLDQGRDTPIRVLRLMLKR